MLRSCVSALLAIITIAPAVHSQAPAVYRVDSLGDPLPAGAVARLGTTRFKHSEDLQLPRNFFGPGVLNTNISATVFTPDSKIIASLSQPFHSIRVWNAATGKQLPGPWSARPDYFQSIALSPDGATLAASGLGVLGGNISGPEIVLWDIATAKEIKTLHPPDGRNFNLEAVAFEDGGKTLLTVASDGMVHRWDIAGGKVERTLKQKLPTPSPSSDPNIRMQTNYQYQFAPDAKSLAVRATAYQFSDDGINRFVMNDALGLDLATGKPRWRAQTRLADRNIVIAFSADGKRVAISVGLNKIELRDAVTGKLIYHPFLDSKDLSTGYLPALALSPDGSTMAIARQDGPVMLWSLPAPSSDPPFDEVARKEQNLKVRKLIGGIAQSRPGFAQTLEFTPDGKSLLVGAGSDLQLYNLATLKESLPREGHSNWVDYVAFSSDGQRLLSGSGSQSGLQLEEVATWNVTTGKWLQVSSTRTPIWPNMGKCSPEHTYYLGKNANDRFNVFSLDTGKLIGRLGVPASQKNFKGGFFSPGSRFYVLPGTDDQNKSVVRLYGLPSCKLLCELPVSIAIISGQSSVPVAFSSDNSLVALLSRENSQIHVFETSTGKPKKTLGRPPEIDPKFLRRGNNSSALAFSPDGKLLASWSATEPDVRIWDVATGNPKMRLRSDEQHNQLHLAWSPDGRILAVGEHKIELWEVATAKLRREFNGHESDVRSLAFSPDGRLLASGSMDSTVLLWDVWGGR
jgi:WD40 repeat protein